MCPQAKPPAPACAALSTERADATRLMTRLLHMHERLTAKTKLLEREYKKARKEVECLKRERAAQQSDAEQLAIYIAPLLGVSCAPTGTGEKTERVQLEK